MIDQFKAARRVGTPLICVHTPDPDITVNSIVGEYAETPVFVWDCITGIKGLTPTGKEEAKKLFGEDDTTNAVTALEYAHKLPERSLFVLMNAHRGVEPTVNPNWVQAVWNLRQPFKSTMRTLVLLCPSANWPAEIAQDILTLDEPLPDAAALKSIILQTFSDAGAPEPEAALVEKAIDATCGLAASAAEQACAMSLWRNKETQQIGLKLDDLWARKKRAIEQTPGLSVWRGGQRFSDVGGLSNIKNYLSRLIAGKRSPRAFAFLDEGEKMFAGSSGSVSDSSGVSQGFLGTYLSFMQDTESSGSLLVGVPGAGKSEIAKAAGAEAGVPVVSFDLNAMKDSLVGSSEARLRSALNVLKSVSQGRCYFLMTCNRIAALPPELKRRFSAIFFFDLPSAEEREAIWSIYLRKYGIPLDAKRPDDADWTGGDIRKCCFLASEELGCSLEDASIYISPVGKTSVDEINQLRAQAHGRYLSASYPGFYKNGTVEAVVSANRAFEAIPEE